jgi:uncharacterized protein YcbX
MTFTVSGLWLYPVQSMRGQKMQALDYTTDGLRLDRWFGIWDVEEAKMVGSAGGKRNWRSLVTWDAHLLTPLDAEEPKVEIRFPDGGHVASDDAEIDRLLSERLERPVEFRGNRGERAPARYALAHCHLITGATLRRLSRGYPEGEFAPERFRPNVLLDCGYEVGFVEQPWVGKRILASSGAVLEGTEDCQRCAMTTRAQGGLPSDPKILHTIMLDNNTNAGIYARVSKAGRIALGDTVQVQRSAAPAEASA